MTQRIDVSLEGCSAVFHPADGALGAIICAGHGYDDLCTYRNFALFADDLAEAGIPTLRFDYHGTGNSMGSDEDPERLEVWLGNIAAAIAFMRDKAGIREIALIGYRLGGMLATLAAARDASIRTLALIAPVLSGRSYIRELQLQSQLYPVKDDHTGDDGGVSVAGFRLSAETVSEIKPINLSKMALPSLDRVMILDNSIDETSPFAMALKVPSTSIAFKPFPALQLLAVDPIHSLSVDQPFEAVRGFLANINERRPSSESVTQQPALLADVGWTETRHRFGPDNRLFGVLCEPNREKTAQTVLFVNGGANRNTGWARMTVRLAHTLAEKGISSLRIDLAGLGESVTEIKGQRPILYSERFRDDVSVALDWLAHHGRTDVAAFGACSGAQAVFQTALKDKRLSAIIMVNLLRFEIATHEAAQIGGAPSFRSTANYLDRIGDPESWKRLWRGGHRKIIGLIREYTRRGAIAARSQTGFAVARLTRQTVFGGPVYRKFVDLVQRKARVLIVYSDVDDGLGELAIHLGRLGRMVSSTGDIRVALLSQTDHNLTSRASQAELGKLLEAFVARRETKSQI